MSISGDLLALSIGEEIRIYKINYSQVR